MRCVKCNTDNNLQDRTENGGRCKNCNHPFAFDPRDGSKFTDVFFKRSIEVISNENTLFFTRKQFLYLLERQRRRKPGEYSNVISLCAVYAIRVIFITPFLLFAIAIANNGYTSSVDFLNSFWGILIVEAILLFLVNIRESNSQNNSSKKKKSHAILIQILGYLCIVGSIIASLTLAISNEMKFFLFLIGIGIGLFSIYFGREQVNRSYYIPQKFKFTTPEEVNTWLNRWMEFNSVEKLLPSPKEESSNIEVSSDISAYSFDRLLVCDSAQIAQFLIANNFHFEHNCAVLSITGYPQIIFNTVMEMLRRNSDLKVYAFHNAGPRGVGLINRLRTSNNWFANSDVIIYDLGLFPRHIFSSKNMFILNSTESAADARQMPATVRQGLSADEIAWLEMGNYVELESFSPQRLLRVASRGIANSQSFSEGESWSGDDGDNLIVGGNSYLFVSDSFG